jgi:hypothetical protein
LPAKAALKALMEAAKMEVEGTAGWEEEADGRDSC